MFTERIVIVNTDPNLRGTFTRRPVTGVIPRVSKVDPSLRRPFRQLSDEVNENDSPQLEFNLQDFDEIRNTLNDGKIPPELEFLNGG